MVHTYVDLFVEPGATFEGGPLAVEGGPVERLNVNDGTAGRCLTIFFPSDPAETIDLAQGLIEAATHIRSHAEARLQAREAAA